MEFDPITLSRIQFGFVISFHIIVPAFAIELAAWLVTIRGRETKATRWLHQTEKGRPCLTGSLLLVAEPVDWSLRPGWVVPLASTGRRRSP
jgi:hypothetical protein